MDDDRIDALKSDLNIKGLRGPLERAPDTYAKRTFVMVVIQKPNVKQRMSTVLACKIANYVSCFPSVNQHLVAITM